MSREYALAAALVLAFVEGCAGTSVRGALTTAPGQEPGGDVLARFQVKQCVDRSRARSDVDAGEQVVVQSGAPRPIIVEKRSGYDSLIITNGYDERDRMVGQAVVDGSGGKLIRQITVPKAALGPNATAPAPSGSLEVARTWTETDLGGGQFRAKLDTPVLSCSLDPMLPAPPTPSVGPSTTADAEAPQVADAAARD